MNIQEALNEGLKILTNSQLPKLESEILLSFSIGQSREFLIAHSDQEISSQEKETFIESCQRRNNGEPIAHITHNKEFFGIKLTSDHRALIPRPETEILVEQVLTFCKSNSVQQIIEIGTGSGNIAIAIAKNTQNIHIVAGEISTEAISLAQQNIEDHGLTDRITLIQSDLLENISSPAEIIVANLPYIGTERHNFVSKETEVHEPHVALFGGETGLELYDKLFTQIKKLTPQPKLVIGEIGFSQREQLSQILSKHFSDAAWSINPDLAGLDRYFTIHL